MGDHNKNDACGTCGGSGKITTTDDGQDGRGTRTMTCSGCGGSGKA